MRERVCVFVCLYAFMCACAYVCVCMCMNAVRLEPNVRPIKVYWDQVVLVSLEVEADLFNQDGAEYDGTGGNGGHLSGRV